MRKILAAAAILAALTGAAFGQASVRATIQQGGNTAGVSVDGALAVNTPPSPQFFDSFSAALDTTTNWTANNSTGTAATSAGTLLVSSSTTSAAWGGVTSKQSWTPSGLSPQVFGVAATFANSIIANTSRIFGMATIPGTPTTAVPVTDGYIWRLDATGALFAEVWATGVAISSTNVTAACKPGDGFPNLYGINFRTNLVTFSCGAVTGATVVGYNPTVQILPVSLFSIAGTSPAATATVSYGGLTVVTYAPGAVKSAGQSPTINDPAQVTVSLPYASGATILGGNASGSTGAVVGTLTGAATATTYLCGFNVSALGTGAVGPIVIAGLIGSSQTYQLTAAAAGSSVGSTFTPCIPSSAVNTNITVTTTADATATAVNVNSWGFRQ